MLIRGSKLIGNGLLFDFETSVVQRLDEDGDLEVIETISLLSSQSSGYINSPLNPESPFNPVNFVSTGEDNSDETSSTIYYYPRVSPETDLNWEPGVDPDSDGSGSGNTGNNNGGSGNNDGNTNSGHQSTNTTGPDGQDYFNPESEVDVPLVLGQNQPDEMIKGQTWLSFDEHGQGVLSVYNGQEWSKVGEELQPLDIGSY